MTQVTTPCHSLQHILSWEIPTANTLDLSLPSSACMNLQILFADMCIVEGDKQASTTGPGITYELPALLVIASHDCAGLPRSMWAAAVPANYGRGLGALVEDIYGDHQLMVRILQSCWCAKPMRTSQAMLPCSRSGR